MKTPHALPTLAFSTLHALLTPYREWVKKCANQDGLVFVQENRTMECSWGCRVLACTGREITHAIRATIVPRNRKVVQGGIGRT